MVLEKAISPLPANTNQNSSAQKSGCLKQLLRLPRFAQMTDHGAIYYDAILRTAKARPLQIQLSSNRLGAGRTLTSTTASDKHPYSTQYSRFRLRIARFASIGQPLKRQIRERSASIKSQISCKAYSLRSTLCDAAYPHHKARRDRRRHDPHMNSVAQPHAPCNNLPRVSADDRVVDRIHACPPAVRGLGQLHPHAKVAYPLPGE